MLEIEEQLRKDGFGDSDKEFDGDFSDEGYSQMKWTAVCRKVEVDVSQLIGGLFGGEVATENLPDQVGAFLEGMKGLPAAGAAGGGKGGEGGEVGGNDLSQLLGGGGMELIFKQVGDTLADSIREITLEISWGGKRDGESIKFVQYVTTTGRLSIPQGGIPAIPGLPGLPGQPGI